MTPIWLICYTLVLVSGENLKTHAGDLFMISAVGRQREPLNTLLLTYDTTTDLVATEEQAVRDTVYPLLLNIPLCEYFPFNTGYYNQTVEVIVTRFQEIKDTLSNWKKQPKPRDSKLGIGMTTNGSSLLGSSLLGVRDFSEWYCRNETWKNRGLEYAVTIRNDHTLLDGQGFIHTWLVIDGIEGNTIKRSLFSFSNSPHHLLKAFPGISTADIPLYYRPSQSLTIPITELKYNLLKSVIRGFWESNPKYMLFPGDRITGVYNCVTASNRILHSIGINLLAGVNDPRDVVDKIEEEKAKITDPRILNYF